MSQAISDDEHKRLVYMSGKIDDLLILLGARASEVKVLGTTLLLRALTIENKGDMPAAMAGLREMVSKMRLVETKDADELQMIAGCMVVEKTDRTLN